MMLQDVVNLIRYKIDDGSFVESCRRTFDQHGWLALDRFLTPNALVRIRKSALKGLTEAYFCQQEHNVYLLPPDPQFPTDHVRNRKVVSSKGCICDDQVESDSPLRILYESCRFQGFVAEVTGEPSLYPYADRLSSINVHYAKNGQELGWHFDNSSFAITLLIQGPRQGGRFEFVGDLRNVAKDPWNFATVGEILDGQIEPEAIEIQPGTLLLFRGMNSIHRVSPNEGDVTRIMAVLAYNREPGISLSENARLTFYGRLG